MPQQSLFRNRSQASRSIHDLGQPDRILLLHSMSIPSGVIRQLNARQMSFLAIHVHRQKAFSGHLMDDSFPSRTVSSSLVCIKNGLNMLSDDHQREESITNTLPCLSGFMGTCCSLSRIRHTQKFVLDSRSEGSRLRRESIKSAADTFLHDGMSTAPCYIHMSRPDASTGVCWASAVVDLRSC